MLHLKRALTSLHIVASKHYIVNVKPQVPCVLLVESVLRIDHGHCIAHTLRLCQNAQRKRRLTAGLWAINFNDSASWHAATKHIVQRQDASAVALPAQTLAVCNIACKLVYECGWQQRTSSLRCMI